LRETEKTTPTRFCEDVRYIRSAMPQPAEFCGALPREL